MKKILISALVLTTFGITTQAVSTAKASSVWVANRELPIPPKSNHLVVMALQGDEEKNLTKKRASCDLIIQEKAYERTLKLGSEFNLVSIRTVPLHDPNLEELKHELKEQFGLNADNVKTLDELREVIIKQANITMIDNTNSTNFELMFRSVKTQTEYMMKCSIDVVNATPDTLETLLSIFGAISPSKDL